MTPHFDRAHTDDLISFVAASPSPYHAVASAAERLEKAGFRQVRESDAWEGGSGGRYVLRVAIGSVATTRDDVEALAALLGA